MAGFRTETKRDHGVVWQGLRVGQTAEPLRLNRRQNLPRISVWPNLFFPCNQSRLPIWMLLLELLFELAVFFVDRGDLLQLAVGVHPGDGFVVVVDEREQPVILFVRDRIVL